MLIVQLSRWLPLVAHRFSFLRDRRAVTSLEYGIIAIVITIAVFGGLSLIGNSMSTTFNRVSSEL